MFIRNYHSQSRALEFLASYPEPSSEGSDFLATRLYSTCTLSAGCGAVEATEGMLERQVQETGITPPVSMDPRTDTVSQQSA